MNLTTNYMGFSLPHPLVPGASPFPGSLDMVRRLEDAGAPLIIMHSLFEEQIVREELAVNRAIEMTEDSFAEALSYFPASDEFQLGPDEYLEHLTKIKRSVAVPVIGSLNGTTPGGWLRYAKRMQEAGADGIELNLYEVAADPDVTAGELERRSLEIVRSVRESVSIPLAVKLSPFYSSLPNFARHLDELGVHALVLFNRFYQPEIDVEHLEIATTLHLSDSSELRLRLRWLGVLYGKIEAALAVTGGVHTPVDAVKSLMAGASAVQMTSALLKRGPEYLADMRRGLAQWLEDHEYESVRQMIGSMSLLRCGDPGAYERANYVKILQTWSWE